MMSEKSSSSANASFAFPVFGLAFVVLLVLKVAGQAGATWGLANLSWFWVFSPLLFGFLFVVFWLVVFVLLVAWASSK